MTTPALSLAIPPAKVSFNATTTKYIIRSDGDIVPQEEESSEDSDVSSICHSPGWENSASKKRKKEKRQARERKKKEKAKAEADAAKQDHRAKSRLSKAPPTNKQLTKTSVSIDRSVSEPAVPVVQPSPEPREVKEESKKDAVGRARRGSFDVGLKSFIQVKNAIPVPWKSSHGTPVQTTPTQEIAPPRISLSKATGGFIGGLKLRQAEEATVQETIRRVGNAPDDDARGLLDSDRDLTAKGPGNLSSNTSIAESYKPTSIYEESIRSPEQWDQIYAQAAMLARSNGIPKDDDTTPIMERNIRKSRRTHPPTSRYFPLVNDPDSSSSMRDTSAASISRTSVKSNQYSGDSQELRESNVSSGQSNSIRGASADKAETAEPTRGRTGSSYVRHQRRQSKDQAVAGFQDQNKVSEAMTMSRARDRSVSCQSSRSRVGSSVDDTPLTTRPATGDSAGNTPGTEPIQSVLNEKYKPPTLQLVSTTEGGFTPRKRSNSAVRGFKELKNAAKSAFGKHSGTPDSPAESFVSANEFQNPTSTRPQLKRTATTGVVNEQSNKAERILRENLCGSPIVQDFAPQNPPTQASNAGVPHRQANVRARGPVKRATPVKESHGRASHSRSATDSSENYSLYDESSNITTPTASRPQSHKDYSPSTREFKSRGGKVEGEKSVQNGFALMSGAVLDDAASGRESWCRTAIPIELTEDEDRMKTPTAKRSAGDFTTSQPNLPKISKTNHKTNSSDLHREPSLSRSISTPEMQDLSFLPELKHQSLARPPKGKGKGTLGKKGKQASISKEQEGHKSPKDLARPPPIPLPGTTTKSEGSSPTSPHSSQYLQNARLNIPRGPHSPMKSGFPPAHLPHPQPGGPEPLAKMFVVCCSCKYFHDMPSKIYECMAKPDNVVRDTNLGVSGVISTSVKCPWCGHGMSTNCCTGYAAVVYLREKLH
jgi:hypothetical protein